jgi:hypothetical protein
MSSDLSNTNITDEEEPSGTSCRMTDLLKNFVLSCFVA